MTCVLGMVVNREREIRNFEKTPFFRVVASVLLGERGIDCEWRAVEGTPYFASPLLYKENGFKEREPAENLIQYLLEEPRKAIVHSIEKKKENKNAPLLYNLAELQNDCSKYFKISPDETLRIAQELYEKKMTTYPRTDARVLSTAVSKEIYKNIKGLTKLSDGKLPGFPGIAGRKPIRESQRQDMLTTSRLLITTPSFRPDRGLIIITS